MANSLNSLGGLSAGSFQAVSRPLPANEKPRPTKLDSEPKGSEEKPAAASAQQLDAAAKTIQEHLQDSQTDMVFSVDQETGGPVFKIVNATTHEVIPQMPSEEVLAMAHKLRKVSTQEDASGLLVDRKE